MEMEKHLHLYLMKLDSKKVLKIIYNNIVFYCLFLFFHIFIIYETKIY
jgi:hypothetical protein